MGRSYVCAGFGYDLTDPSAIVWTDITQYADVASAGISITRGASDELSQVQPSTCTMTLDNVDGRFTPGLATGAYYPNVKKNCPIRVGVVSAVKNLMVNPSFEEGVTAWTSSGVPTRAQSTTHVQDGTYAMLVTWGATLDQTVTSPVLYGFDIGKVYTFSAYVYVPAGHGTVYLTVAGITNGTANTTFGAFQRLTVTWTATSTSHQVRLRATNTPAAGNQAWMDACQIEEGATATTYDSTGAVQHDRFWGMVNEWPLKFDGLLGKTTITCTDIFKWLSRQPALQPMLVEEILLLGPVSYYTLAEPADSTTVGDLSGQVTTALSITQAGSGGTLTFAGSAGPAGTGQDCPTFTPSTSTAGKYLTADLGAQFQYDSGQTYIVVEAWFQTSTTDRVICSLKSSGGAYQVTLALENSTGKLQVTTVGQAGTTVVAFATASLADGAWHQVVYNENGYNIYVDGVYYGPTSLDSMHDLRLLAIGSSFGTRLWNGALAHVAVYTLQHSLDIAEDAAAHYEAGTIGFAGEDADVRIQRLATYAAIQSVTTYGTAFDPQASQGPGGATALDQMRQVAMTESAVLFADRDWLGVTINSRSLRYNPSPEEVISYPDLETGDVEFADDDQKMCNTVVGSRPGGATQRVVDATARAAYGPYEQQLDILKTSDLSVLDAANWTVSRYADPQPEVREVVIEAYSLGQALYRQMLLLELGSVITVTDLPATAPSATQTLFVEGYTETIRHNYHLIGFHTSRSYNDSVWVLDDTAYSVLGSTTRLGY